MAIPVQAFQIGQRVRKESEPPLVIRGICLTNNGWILYSINDGYPYFTASELTLAPERPPYVPSERRTLTRRETDAEMAARHAVERAEYDAQGDGA